MLLGMLIEKKLFECAKKKSKDLRVEKVIKREGDKLYFKWKGYDNSFNI